MRIEKIWLSRILAGGVLGMAVGYFLVGVIISPGFFWRLHFTGDFTLYIGWRLPEPAGSALSLLLWFCFGAEIGVATLPFAESGGDLLLRSLLHFVSMAVTVSGWVLLNLERDSLPLFLISLTLIYLLIWLGRWVGWYAEVGEIRAKLGLTGGPSPLKWRETLPHMAFAALLCLVLPVILCWCDAPDVPVLSIFYGWILLPVGGFASAASLGRRQGFCPLYPAACVGFILMFMLLTRRADGALAWVALAASLLGILLGWWVKWVKGRRRNEQSDFLN